MVKIQMEREANQPRPVAEVPVGVLAELSEIMCPLTGEIVDVKDVDGLIGVLERVKEKKEQCQAVEMRCRLALAELTEGDAVTRRVRGKRRAAKVTMPDVSFDQSILKALWNSHPKLAQEYLKISTIAVQMAPYKKLVGTASQEPDFVYFRDALTGCERGRVGTPSVVVET